MTIDVQMMLNSDIKYKSFIRENPIWYKKLNRNPSLFKEFNSEMKDKYKLNMSDKLNKMIDNLSMVESILSILK